MAVHDDFPECEPLPANPFSVATDTTFHDAYQQCVLNEADASVDAKLLMYARCLGYLILEAPDDNARNYVSHEILSCDGDSDKLNSLAEFYIQHLFRLFRKNKGHTPIPSYHPSRPSFENERAFFSLTVDPAPNDHTTAKRAAFERDNYRCMVTGIVDQTYWMSLSRGERVTRNLAQASIGRTKFCHIFPPSTNWDLEKEKIDHPNTHYTGSVSALLNGFAGINVLDELNGSDCHKLYNGLTLNSVIQDDFDELMLWFEAIPNAQHRYRVCTQFSNNFILQALPANRIVTFSTTTDLPLPDPRYLKLHATICRVAHLSGISSHMDNLERELEETRILAHDGSSAKLLVWRLQDISGP